MKGISDLVVAYAPQLGSRLHISHTRLNIIGLAGNSTHSVLRLPLRPNSDQNKITVGVYSTAPFLGRIADLRGPRGLLSAAFVLLLVGYLGIRYIFINGGGGDGQLHVVGFWLLVICSYMTGVGGNGGLVSGVNVTAKSFPDRVVSLLHCIPDLIGQFTGSIFRAESDGDGNSPIWLRPLRILLLNPLRCLFPWRNIIFPPRLGARNIPSHDNGPFPHKAYPAAYERDLGRCRVRAFTNR